MADDAAIRPEFKKAMDSYEAFFGEFVEFMQLLSDDPSNLTLMAKYADYMSQYTETMEALETIDESELTASELSYYIGVMSRIQQMVPSCRSRLTMRGDAENELLEQADHCVACGSADLYSVRLRAVADPTDYGDETAFEAT